MGSEATKGKGAVTGGDVVVYEEKGGRVRLEVRLEGETVGASPQGSCCRNRNNCRRR